MVLKIHELLEPTSEVTETQGCLTLPFELRQKSRLKAQLDDGTEVGLMLPRGGVLRSGDLLKAENNMIIKVVAANESVSTAKHNDPLLLARACYHLGNRHVPLQIANHWLRYAHDHVLDDMVRGLGLEVIHEIAPFEPEGGAYGGGHHHHSHDDHDHEQHGHSHSH